MKRISLIVLMVLYCSFAGANMSFDGSWYETSCDICGKRIAYYSSGSYGDLGFYSDGLYFSQPYTSFERGTEFDLIIPQVCQECKNKYQMEIKQTMLDKIEHFRSLSADLIKKHKAENKSKRYQELKKQLDDLKDIMKILKGDEKENIPSLDITLPFDCDSGSGEITDTTGLAESFTGKLDIMMEYHNDPPPMKFFDADAPQLMFFLPDGANEIILGYGLDIVVNADIIERMNPDEVKELAIFIVFAKDIYASEVFGRALMRKLLPVWLLKEQGEQNVKTN